MNVTITITYSDGTQRTVTGVGSYWVDDGNLVFFATPDYTGDPIATQPAGPRLGSSDDTPRVTAISES